MVDFRAVTRVLSAGLLAVVLGSNISGPANAQDAVPVVFAAASLKNAFDDVNAAWKAESGHSATISYAASSALAKQIESGASADVFASADLAWMDYLAGLDLIKPETRVALLGNELVLIAPAGASVETTIEPGFDLSALLAGGKLAMANVASVPAGKYGKAALENLGAWAGVEKQVAQAENVRAALLLVSRGEAPLGIVYKTDAVADPSVQIIGTFPAATHEPIVYPVAITSEARSPNAAALLSFMQTAKARDLFEKQGFTVLAQPR